jgi:hypothetical protein
MLMKVIAIQILNAQCSKEKLGRFCTLCKFNMYFSVCLAHVKTILDFVPNILQ